MKNMKIKNNSTGKNSALYVAATLFSIVAIVHLVRFFMKWIVVIGNMTIPIEWSLYGGVIIAVLALWMFWTARK